MMNLLPPEEKEVRSKELRVRVWVLLFLSLGAAFTLGALSLLPGYLSFKQDQILYASLLESAALRNAESASRGIEKEAELLMKRVGVIERSFDDAPMLSSRVVRLARSYLVPGISLGSVGYKRIVSEGEVPKLTISGVAVSREALLAFTRALRAEPAFTEVDAPISQLAPKSNLPFTITAQVVAKQP